jgi:hypothetical protein
MGGPYYDSDGEPEPSRGGNSYSLPDYGGKPFGAGGRNKPGAYGGDNFPDLSRVEVTSVGVSVNGAGTSLGVTKSKTGKTTIDIDQSGIGGSVGFAYDPDTGKWSPHVAVGGSVPIGPYTLGISHDPTAPNPNAALSVGAAIKGVIGITELR